jgi:hypothetical protein
MGLLEAYNNLTAEEQSALGKQTGGTKINTAGTHLVEIVDFKVIDGTRVKIDFKDELGKTIDYTGFLTNKDPSKVEATVNRVMNQIGAICIAAGLNLKSVLSKSTNGTETFKSGTVPTEEYPTAKGKKLYITTYVELEPDDKDPKKVWQRQVIDVFKFFDIKKRNGLEIANDIDEGLTMEVTDAEAKSRVEINYLHTNNPACQAKLAELVGGKYTGPAATSQAPVSDEEI